MDERLQGILQSVQKKADSVTASASDAMYGVGKKATQMLSVSKMNMRIMDLQTEVSAQLRSIGELVYATHTGEPTDSDVLLQKLQVIDGLKAQIDALTAEVAKARGVAPVCPVCGTPGVTGDAFCRGCGRKL
jgi:uncharacterized small protein (DUF1192 family)